MRKVLGGLFGSVFFVLVAVLIGPSFVDWNAYKSDLSDAARQATGRDLHVDGDIGFSLLPSPKLTAENIRLANAPGASTPDMVQLKSLEVRLSLGGLLGGTVQVDAINLVAPVIHLEQRADGSANWQFTPLADGDAAGKDNSAASEQDGSSGGAASAAPDIRLDNFTISDGTVVFRDASGKEQTLSGLNAGVSAESLTGPFATQGNAVVRNIPVSFVVTTGAMIEGRTMPINVTLSTDAGGAKLSVDGAVVDVETAPQFKGKAALSGDNLAALGALAGQELPGSLAKAFSIGGEVNATQAGATARNIEISLGDIQGAANMDVALEGGVGIGLAVRLQHVDLDALLKAPHKKPSFSDRKATAPAKADGDGKAASEQTDAGQTDAGFPRDIAASVDVTVDALTLKGAKSGPFKLAAEMVNGEITVSQASVQLPGGADVSAFGFVTAAKAGPTFEGEVDTGVADLRALAGWLGTDLSAVPADRLRKASVKAQVTASAEQVSLGGLTAVVDGSTLTGGVTARLGGRPAVAVDVSVDKIDVDAYRPKGGAQQAAPAASASALPETTKPEKGKAAQAVGAWQALNALTTFDATVKARVKRAVVNGTPMNNAALDAVLSDGVLTVNRLTVADWARAATTVSGTVKGLGGIPSLQGVSVAMTARDPARLMAAAGQQASPTVRALGPVELAAQVNGTVLRPQVKATVGALGGQAGVDGVVSVLPLGGGFKGNVTLTHGDGARLFKALGYRPAGKVGALAFTAKADADADSVSLSDMGLQWGQNRLGGTLETRLGGVRPKVTARLSGDGVDITPLLPADNRRADIQGRPGVIPAAMVLPDRTERPFRRVVQLAAAPSGRWPTTPLDLSGLKALDADVTLKANTLKAKGYVLDNADLAATLTDGVLTVSRLTGGLFGGSLSARMVTDGRSGVRMEQSVDLKNVPLDALTRAATGAPLTTGTLTVNTALAGQGVSVAALMETLQGNGSVAMTGMDVSKGAKKTAFAPVLDLLLGLNQLGGGLTGGKASKQADVQFSFVADRGIFTSNDIQLTSGLGNGSGKAKVDLAGWRINADGEVNMSQNVLGQLLSAKANVPSRVPFSINGPLDKPNVKIDSAATAGGIVVPGVEKLLKKKGVGDVLQGILGGSKPAPSQPSQPAPLPPKDGDGTLPPPPPSGPTPQPQSQPQKIDPRDLLRGLLGR